MQDKLIFSYFNICYKIIKLLKRGQRRKILLILVYCKRQGSDNFYTHLKRHLRPDPIFALAK